MKKNLLHSFLFFLVLFIGCLPSKSTAQNSAHDYQFSAGTMPFTPISGGTSLSTIHGDDQYVTNIPIGFSYTFAGRAYTTVSISSNGWLSLSTVSTSQLTNSLTNAQDIDPLFFIYWDDMTGGSGTASYSTIGTAPNRIFVVQFLNWQRLSASGPMFDMQIRMHENGTVEYNFRDQSGTHTGPSASVGIMDHNHNYQSLPSVAANPTPSITTFTTSISAKPANNQYYRWAIPPCTSPPTPGTAVIVSNCSVGGAHLNVRGNSMGLNQTYEWEYSANNTTFTSIGAASPSPAYNWATPSNGWVRCKVQCGTGTPVYTAAVQLTLNTGLPAGTYTINSAAATTGNNFASFTALASALSCGIQGPIVVNVTPGSGPYTEQFILGDVLGTSATNTIRINGNGNTLQFNGTSTSNMHIVYLDGTKYLTLDSLHIKTLNATYGWGVFLTGGAHHDTIRNCHIDLSTITGTSTVNANGIVMHGSSTSMGSTGAGNNANNIYIANNLIDAGNATSSGGGYYGIYMYGQSSTAFGTDTIHIINNEIKNFYYYGIYGYYNRVVNIENNNIHKSTKTATTSNYGIYLYYSSAAKILKNRIHDFSVPTLSTTSSIYPIYLYAPTNDNNAANATLIANNAIYNVGNYGGTFYGIYASQGFHTNIYHNTISQNLTSTGTSTQYGIYVSNSSGTINIKNNIIDFKGGNTGTKHGIYNASVSGIAPNGIQMNTVNMASTQFGTQYRIYHGAAFDDLAAFRLAYPLLEVNSRDIDPAFTNITNGMIEPINPGVYRTGENLTALVPRDIDNATRPTTPTIGAKEMAVPLDRDLALLKFTNPLVFCGGPEPVKIEVANYGSQNITSFVINWSVNNVAQTPYTWTGTLTSSNIVEVTVGNFNFAQYIDHDLRFTVSRVNNNTDQRSINDTLNVLGLHSAMSGTYTINRNAPASATNYTSFTALSDALNTNGICGPVVINVVQGSGPYVERFLLDDIRGTSSVNTITINGNENTLQFNSTAQADMHMVIFNGTKHVKIDNLKIKTLNASYGYGILFTLGAAYDSITNCHIDLSSITGTSSTNASAIAFSSSMTSATGSGNNARNIYIGNNLIDAGHPTTNGGAYYAISVYGLNSTNYGTDSIYIVNNELRNFYYYGIYAYYAGDLIISNNNIHKSTKTSATGTNYGIYTYYTSGEITNNRVHSLSPLIPTNTNSQYGIYTAYMNNSATYGKRRFNITNNVVYNVGNSGIFYGIYAGYGDSAYVAHNTVHVNVGTGTSTSTQYGLYVINTTNSYQLRNNNVTFTAGNTGTKYGIYASTSTMFNTNTGWQNNNVLMNSSRTGTQHRAYYGGAARATLAVFQAAFPTLDVDGIEEDPMYLNVTTGDFTPTNPLVLMKGEDLTAIIPDDINGNSRPVPPSPGAFDLSPEFWNNAGTVQLNAPSGNFCSGYRAIQAQVRNAGYNDINTLTVNWSVNGVLQTPLLITNTIDGTMTSNVNVANVTLGTAFIPFGYPSTIKIWTSMPNNKLDEFNSNDTIVTTVQPTSTLATNLGADTTLCDGQVLSLQAGLATQTQFLYSWDNMSTNYRRDITTAGRYWVIKTDIRSECSGHDTIVVKYNPTPSVDLGANIAICPGDSALISVGSANAANTVLWNDNNTSHDRYLTTPAEYSVVVTNQFGCSATDHIRIIGKDTVFHDGINAIYMLNATYNFNVKSPQNISYAVWNYGDGSPEDTGFQVTHQYAREGRYNVTVKLYSACSDSVYTSYSESFDAIGLGVNNIAIKASLDIYPNPAQNNINVSVKEGFAIEQVIIYNVLGQQVGNHQFTGNSTKANVNLDGLASGIYNMQVVTDKGVMQAKFEILK